MIPLGEAAGALADWLPASDECIGLRPEMIGSMTVEEFDAGEASYSGLFPTLADRRREAESD